MATRFNLYPVVENMRRWGLKPKAQSGGHSHVRLAAANAYASLIAIVSSSDGNHVQMVSRITILEGDDEGVERVHQPFITKFLLPTRPPC